MQLILGPEWRLRKERGSILLYKISDAGTIEDYRLITPQTAILISLFDGERSENNVIEALAYVTGHSLKYASEMVRSFITDAGDCLVDVKSVKNKRKLNPMDFIMNSEDVDLIHRRLSAPLTLVYMVTNECQANCIYCYAGKQGGNNDLLSLHRVREILEECVELGIHAITISGGDPFMHPNILDILRYIVDLELIYSISTKCFLSETVINRLVEIGIDRIQISIDSPNSRTMKILTGIENYVEKMSLVIKCFISKGITVSTNSVITAYNIREIPELISLLASLGIRNIGLSAYTRSYYRHTDTLFPSDDDIKWLQDLIPYLQDKYDYINIKYNGKKDPEPYGKEKIKAFAMRTRCTAGMRQLAIYPDGKVVTCEEVPAIPEFIVGDLSRQSIREIWNSEKLFEVIRPPREKFQGQPCYNCLDFYECHAYLGRCYMQALKSYGNFYAPTPECPKAQPGLRIESRPCR